MNTAAWVGALRVDLRRPGTRRFQHAQSIGATVSIPEKSAMPVGCAAQRGQREVAGVGSVRRAGTLDTRVLTGGYAGL